MATTVAGEQGAGLLRPAELAMWRTFLRAHARATRALEAELLAEHDLPLPSYDVLLQLAEAPERALRMTELADRVLLSRSGLTRLVDRLERELLVARRACPSDARGTLAVLTDEGLARLRAAAPTHLRGIAEHVTGRLTEQELAQLSQLLDKLAGTAGQPGGSGTSGASGTAGGPCGPGAPGNPGASGASGAPGGLPVGGCDAAEGLS